MTDQDVERWTETAREKGATHVIVVCDSFSYEDYPVYIMPGESLKDKRSEYDGKSMQRVVLTITMEAK